MQENTGTSLLEAFTVEEVQTHLNRLQKAAPSSTREPSVPCNPANPEACSACGVVKLAFEPAAVFCTSCNQRIKKNQVGRLNPSYLRLDLSTADFAHRARCRAEKA